MKQSSLEGLYEKLRQFDRLADKEEYLFDAIKGAIEAENFEFAAQICDFVLNEEFEKFGAKSSVIEKELIDEANEAMLFYYERLELSLAAYYKALMN